MIIVVNSLTYTCAAGSRVPIRYNNLRKYTTKILIRCNKKQKNVKKNKQSPEIELSRLCLFVFLSLLFRRKLKNIGNNIDVYPPLVSFLLASPKV